MPSMILKRKIPQVPKKSDPYLSSDVVDKSVHTRLHAKAVLAWQQLWIPVPVETHAARQ